MRKAICFGTNYEGTANALTWCVKDAQDWGKFFMNLGFIVELYLEHEVSKQVFKEKLKELVVNSVSGDILGVTYSGHGSRKYNHAEEDFYDETLYFLDGMLIDDEVREILDFLPDGVQLFLFFDSCHSEGMMRLLGENAIKYIQPDFVIPGAKLRRSWRFELPGKEVFISGCMSDEYSFDAGELRNGAATYYALQTYQHGNTFQEWYDRIREYLPSAKYPQTPFLSATSINKDRIAFEEPEDEEDEPSLSWFQKLWNKIKDFFRKLFGL